MNKEIEIKNCQDCPFANNDNERGKDQCNLKDITLDYKNWEELPSDKVHEECPLKEDSYLMFTTM